MNPQSAKHYLTAHYPIIGVLLGSFLVAVSMGTYTNWDSQLEYQAASSVATTGYPYVESGYMINQPPLGFYVAAPILRIFSLSYLNGVYLSTLFGLGAVALVYTLGVLMYGRKTGLVASALFGLVPWHVYMSRIFLIDNQCIFWSLLFLVFGVLAVKRNLQKLVLPAGVFFSLAFLTKLFAVFSLIPMLLILLLNQKQSPFKLTKKTLLLFLLPSIVLQAVWYGGFAHQNFEAVYISTDLYHPVLVDASATYLPTIYVNSAGVCLFLAMFASLALVLAYRKRLDAYLRMDVVCVATIVAISALNMLLVLGLRLTVPYVSFFKYTYLALPFFCLLAGSVADKGAALLGSVDWRKKRDWIKPALVTTGLILVFASLLESIGFLNTWVIYASFGVDSVTYYPFNLYTDTAYPGQVTLIHYCGLALVLASMLLPFLLDKRKTTMETANSRTSDRNSPE